MSILFDLPNTVIVEYDYMKDQCPVCRSVSSSEFYCQRSGYEMRRCQTCGLVFLGEITRSVNDEFFDDAEDTISGVSENKDAIEYWSYPKYFDAYHHVFTHFFQDRWKKISDTGKKVDSLLDIGCGYGFFLEYMKQHVSNVRGIDLNSAVARYAREVKGLAVEECPVEKFDPDNSFDCIVMCDVLEHVENLNEILASCYSILNNEGVLYVQVPSLVGFKIPFGHSWGLPHHIWHFDPKNLKLLLENNGFKVHEWHTGVLGVVGSYVRGGPTIREKILWFLAKFFKVGNRLQMVAIKS